MCHVVDGEMYCDYYDYMTTPCHTVTKCPERLDEDDDFDEIDDDLDGDDECCTDDF